MSCNNPIKEPKLKKEDNSKHKIISKVIETTSLYLSPRTLSPITGKWKFTKEDSIQANKKMIEFVNKFRIIAIDTSLVVDIPNYSITKSMFEGNDFSAIDKAYDSLLTFKIDINKIRLKKVTNAIYFDSITYFNSLHHLTKYRSYTNIDYRFNFSPIVYDKEKNKAAIRCIYRFEDRYPDGAIFLLEKKDDGWLISKAHYFLGY